MWLCNLVKEMVRRGRVVKMIDEEVVRRDYL